MGAVGGPPDAEVGIGATLSNQPTAGPGPPAGRLTGSFGTQCDALHISRAIR
jgi:hypothetical protein